jgi:hypothetical protein
VKIVELLLLSFACSSAIVGCKDRGVKQESVRNLACAPGKSIACAGPGGCEGDQVCKEDGSGFSTCNCRAHLASTTTAAVKPSAPVAPKKPSLLEPYANGRFGFELLVPKWLIPGKPPVNGDGLEWSGDGGVTTLHAGAMRSVGSGVGGEDFRREYEAELSERPTYKEFGGNWYVVSGYERQDVYYTKCVRGETATACFTISYPKDLRAKYDPLLGEMARSFRFNGRGLQ